MTRIVHLADLHLGAQRYDRLTAGGRNLREADVARTWAATVALVVAQAPDVILVAGDVFDTTRPSNAAIMEAMTGFRQLAACAPVIVIDGNHETPKDQARGGILPLLRHVGVQVVHRTAERLRLPELGASVLCVPERVAHTTDLRPDPDAPYNILLLHGEIADTIPGSPVTDATIPRERITDMRWDYIALGHYHVTTEVARRCWYAGAIDYTSSDVWREQRTEAALGYAGKGFLVAETATGDVTRVPIPSSRAYIDLPVIEAADRTPDELYHEVLDNLATISADVELPVVRQVIRDIPRHIARAVPALHDRALRASCCNLAFDQRRPEPMRRDGSVPLRSKRPDLHELLAEAVTRTVSPAADRAAVLALGNVYLDHATEEATV